jgi:hypothetical protein
VVKGCSGVSQHLSGPLVCRLGVPKRKHVMAKKAKGRGRPKTTGPGMQISVRCQADFLARVDEWRAKQPPQPGRTGELSRPAAILWLAALGMKAVGLITADPEGLYSGD